MGIKEKSFDVRYFTYYLIFPGNNDYWVDQTPFIHDLQFQLKQTRWRNDKKICDELLKKGETKWKDHNGVTHRVVIEDVERPRRWGTQVEKRQTRRRIKK